MNKKAKEILKKFCWHQLLYNREHDMAVDNAFIGIRMDFDKRMEQYVTENNET